MHLGVEEDMKKILGFFYRIVWFYVLPDTLKSLFLYWKSYTAPAISSSWHKSWKVCSLMCEVSTIRISNSSISTQAFIGACNRMDQHKIAGLALEVWIKLLFLIPYNVLIILSSCALGKTSVFLSFNETTLNFEKDQWKNETNSAADLSKHFISLWLRESQ